MINILGIKCATVLLKKNCKAYLLAPQILFIPDEYDYRLMGTEADPGGFTGCL